MERPGIELTHRALLDAALEIGSICEIASWASYELAEAVEKTGKAVGAMTVSELSELIYRQRQKWIASTPEENDHD